jgi:hypothetical protein
VGFMNIEKGIRNKDVNTIAGWIVLFEASSPLVLFEASSPRTCISPACGWYGDCRGTRHNNSIRQICLTQHGKYKCCKILLDGE